MCCLLTWGTLQVLKFLEQVHEFLAFAAIQRTHDFGDALEAIWKHCHEFVATFIRQAHMDETAIPCVFLPLCQTVFFQRIDDPCHRGGCDARIPCQGSECAGFAQCLIQEYHYYKAPLANFMKGESPLDFLKEPVSRVQET